MLQKLVIDDQKYRFNAINTTNLDTTGVNMKKREANEKKEIELLNKKINELKLQNQAEERRKKQLEEEIKRNQKNEEERIKKEKELQELTKKLEEERQKGEQRKKEIESAKIKEEKLNEEMKQKKIKIDKLDGIIDEAGKLAEIFGYEVGAGILLITGGALLTMICPAAGPFVVGIGLGTIGTGGLGVAGSGGVALGAKIIKEYSD